MLGSAGLLVGALFGVAAQRSRFCLRAACIEVAEGQPGPRLAIWLVAFTAALAAVQGMLAAGVIRLDQARALASVGSLSGAILGGLMFGTGMILARGCASRLLVLASSGNLRALITGLVVTLVAQASFRGVLSPLRQDLAALWTIPGGQARDLGAILGIPHEAVAFGSAVALLAALAFARLRSVPAVAIAAGVGVGLAVALGWLATFAISQASFDLVPVASVTFTGPATDTLMALVAAPRVPVTFGIGACPRRRPRGRRGGADLGRLAARALRRRHPDGTLPCGCGADGVRRDACGGLCGGGRAVRRLGPVAHGMAGGAVDVGGRDGNPPRPAWGRPSETGLGAIPIPSVRRRGLHSSWPVPRTCRDARRAIDRRNRHRPDRRPRRDARQCVP